MRALKTPFPAILYSISLVKRALYLFKRALYLFKRALYVFKRKYT